MKTRVKAGLAIALAATAGNAVADYAYNLTVARVRTHTNGYVYVGVTPQPSGTCSLWGEYWRFDPTTPIGKSLMATLLTAKATGRPIEMWYNASSVPGTDQASGCTDSTLAVLTAIGLSR